MKKILTVIMFLIVSIISNNVYAVCVYDEDDEKLFDEISKKCSKYTNDEDYNICIMAYWFNIDLGFNSRCVGQSKSKSIAGFQRKTTYSKTAPAKLYVSNYLYHGNVESADTLLLTNTFLNKFSTPYIAVKLPVGTTINRNKIVAQLNYSEVDATIDKVTVIDKIKTHQWGWINNNSTKRTFSFTLDDSQKNRILSVLNILYPPGEGKYWDVLNFTMPENFGYPAKNWFLGNEIIFEYELNVQEQPTEIEYLVSVGKMIIGPIVDTIFQNHTKTAPKPALDFIGQYGTSKAGMYSVTKDFPVAVNNWLCNCSDKDYTVTLNASVPDWNINDFSFYRASGDADNNNFQIGSKIGVNGAQLSIHKSNGQGVEGTNYPSEEYDMCNCVHMVTSSNRASGIQKLPGILNITAQDTSDANIKAKANVAFFQSSNAIYPVLNVKNDGTNLTLSWYDPFATSYTLFYLPMDLSKVGQVTLSKLENATVPSSNIPPLYIAIYACHADGTCDFSNIEKTQ